MFDMINIKNSFMKGVISTIITKLIKKNGINLDLNLEGLEIKFEDDTARIHLEIDGVMSKDELMKLVKDKLF